MNQFTTSHGSPVLPRQVVPDGRIENPEIGQFPQEEAEGHRVVDGSIPMDEDVPECFQSLYGTPHIIRNDPVRNEVIYYLVLHPRQSEIFVPVDDRTDIEDILYRELDFFVNAVLYEAEGLELLER